MEVADFDKIENKIWRQVNQGTSFSDGLNRILEEDGQISSGEWIEIHDLDVKGGVGVPESERENPQRLLISLRFQIKMNFAALNDQLEKTIDYASVAAEVQKVVESGGARLIETLVSDIGQDLMMRYPIQRLEVELKKFVLPNARYVSVKAEWKAF